MSDLYQTGKYRFALGHTSHNISFPTYRLLTAAHNAFLHSSIRTLCALSLASYTISHMAYKSRVVSALLAHERRLLSKLSTPQKIQDYLDLLSINYELRGETYISPRRVMEARSAHCFEGAVFAAAALAYHGQRPLLMDLRTIGEEEDHVIALFKQNGYWGAISKTNHPVLRYRDPVYASLRELALSYFHEYFDARGIKSLREYSAPFDLSKYPVERWLTASEDLFDLVEALDSSRHFPLVPKKNSSSLRSASKIERVASEHPEWSRRGKRRAL